MPSGVSNSESTAQTVLRVLNIVVPAALGNALEYLPVCIGIGLVGHESGRGKSQGLELDALALSRAYFNMVAFAPGFGLITALRTLCPQCVGAGQPRLCAVYIQRATLFVLAGSTFIVPLLLNSARILRLIGQPEELANMAQPCVLRMLPIYYGCVGE